MENTTITIEMARYEELLQAEIQRNIMLNIVKNTPSYNVAEYIRNAFDIDLPKDDEE